MDVRKSCLGFKLISNIDFSHVCLKSESFPYFMMLEFSCSDLVNPHTFNTFHQSDNQSLPCC